MTGRAEPVVAALPSRDEYFARWARLHGGYDPRSARLVRFWLGVSYVLARPLARSGITPDVVTLGGAVAAAWVVALASLDSRWAWVGAALLVVASGLLDSLDGAVAVLTDHASRWGYVLDSVADRVGDLLFVAALWRAGAPGPVAALGGAIAGLHEYARARAAAGGMPEVGVVTVFERPTRVIVTAAFLLAAGVLDDRAWASYGAWAWVGLGTVGLGQLLFVVRRRLA